MSASSLSLLLSLGAAAAAQAPSSEPLLAASGDGSWLVREAIHEEPPPLAASTAGLLIDEAEWAKAQAAARAVAEAEEEAAVRRAFEEAVDAARRESRR